MLEMSCYTTFHDHMCDEHYISDLVQDCSISIAVLQSCTIDMLQVGFVRERQTIVHRV